ncbi:hypothetical protein GCM10025875_35590 [Litorihabitans aurantiacus]|uniref:Uncharacterized protein n=2 Tax=Litorihabitans aurantiacus TaxID=1930061 RepID=A0AA38CXM2_9MICO|nr:hypothetical protein GCM10025875_35590 [Litorihabitans aurantiacus]
MFIPPLYVFLLTFSVKERSGPFGLRVRDGLISSTRPGAETMTTPEQQRVQRGSSARRWLLRGLLAGAGAAGLSASVPRVRRRSTCWAATVP